MRLLLKYPSRARWQWFQKTLELYYFKLSVNCDFQFLVTLDEDDVSMNTSEVREFLDSQPNLIYQYGKSKTKIEACNADMNLADEWDILVLISDDMIPIVNNFDEIIVDNMQKYFPDLDGALHFNDGLYGKDRTITLSIMGRKLYERFGYLYHPAYRSFYCDNEFTDEVYALGKAKYISQIIIQHKWHGGPKSNDALYRRNSGMKGDEVVYNRRKLLGFPKENGWGL